MIYVRTPQGWKQKPLKRVAEIERQGIQPDQISPDAYYVGLENVDGGGNFIGVQNAQSAELKSTKFSFSDQHILYGKLRPYLRKISRPEFSGVCSTDILPIRPKNGLDKDYLFHYLRQQRLVDFASTRCTGINLPRLSPKALAEFPVIYPDSPDEQKRIAAILDKADAIRRKRRQALGLADQFLRAVFLDMFGDPMVNNRGWPTKSLKKLGRVTTGSTPPSSKEGMFGGEIPFVTPGDLESNSIVMRTVSQDGAQHSRMVRKGSTLVCCIGATIGKVGLATQQSAFNQQINAIEWNDQVDDLFGYFLVSLSRKMVIDSAITTTLPILKKSKFEQIDVPVPPTKLQAKFVEYYKKVLSANTRQTCFEGEADILFNSLTQRAFRGEL
ncbi:MAG: restriction endonuclease subunit S [Magnetococcales bacterium]|nr:restriction endonuclease subunit S [Magnetococcales bacterium]